MNMFFNSNQEKERRIRANEELEQTSDVEVKRPLYRPIYKAPGRCKDGDAHPKNTREPND